MQERVWRLSLSCANHLQQVSPLRRGHAGVVLQARLALGLVLMAVMSTLWEIQAGIAELQALQSLDRRRGGTRSRALPYRKRLSRGVSEAGGRWQCCGTGQRGSRTTTLPTTTPLAMRMPPRHSPAERVQGALPAPRQWQGVVVAGRRHCCCTGRPRSGRGGSYTAPDWLTSSIWRADSLSHLQLRTSGSSVRFSAAPLPRSRHRGRQGQKGARVRPWTRLLRRG